MNYSRITELLRRWEQFESTVKDPDIADFGAWLSEEKEAAPGPTGPGEVSTQQHEAAASMPSGPANQPWKAKLSEESASHVEFYKTMSAEKRFLTLISRSARFIDFYMKKAFEALPLHSRLEFQFLIGISEMGQPRKTDLIHFSLTELSTGLETLKRMRKSGLIEDIRDREDGRSIRVQLTEEGRQVLQAAMKRIGSLDRLAYGFGDRWEDMIPGLQAFNDRQNELYFESRDKQFNEIQEILEHQNHA